MIRINETKFDYDVRKFKKNRNKKVSLAKNKIDINVSQLGSVYALSELGSDMNLIINS